MNDHGGGVIVVVVVGGSYLTAEWVGLTLLVAGAGAVIAIIMTAVAVGGVIRLLVINPLGGLVWVIGSSTLISIPFLLMYTIALNGQTSRDVNDMSLGETLLGPICFVLLVLLLAVIAVFYGYCEQIGKKPHGR